MVNNSVVSHIDDLNDFPQSCPIIYGSIKTVQFIDGKYVTDYLNVTCNSSSQRQQFFRQGPW